MGGDETANTILIGGWVISNEWLRLAGIQLIQDVDRSTAEDREVRWKVLQSAKTCHVPAILRHAEQRLVGMAGYGL